LSSEQPKTSQGNLKRSASRNDVTTQKRNRKGSTRQLPPALKCARNLSLSLESNLQCNGKGQTEKGKAGVSDGAGTSNLPGKKRGKLKGIKPFASAEKGNCMASKADSGHIEVKIGRPNWKLERRRTTASRKCRQFSVSSGGAGPERDGRWERNRPISPDTKANRR